MVKRWLVHILSLTLFSFCYSVEFLKSQSIKADISFMIADLKVTKNDVKILEFGDATWSGFRGFGFIYGRGAAWNLFWQHVSSFKLPVFFVGKTSWHEKSIGKFIENPLCRYVSSIADLEQDQLFKKFMGNIKPLLLADSIFTYKGIVIFDRYCHTADHLSFSKKYPSCLVLNEAIHMSAQYKHLTGKLFDTPELKKFRPKFGIYDRKYTPDLSAKIMKEIPAQHYVVKPAYASQGHGVLMLPKEELEDTLKFILEKGEYVQPWKIFDTTAHDYLDSYGYWHRPTKNTCFIVEEFVPSQEIIVAQKPYDPTMRVLFALNHSRGNIDITFLGAYWKKPIKSLDEEGSFRAKHISNIPKNKPSAEINEATAVSVDDYRRVQGMLKPILQALYEKMLLIHHNKADILVSRHFLHGED